MTTVDVRIAIEAHDPTKSEQEDEEEEDVEKSEKTKRKQTKFKCVEYIGAQIESTRASLVGDEPSRIIEMSSTSNVAAAAAAAEENSIKPAAAKPANKQQLEPSIGGSIRNRIQMFEKKQENVVADLKSTAPPSFNSKKITVKQQQIV